MESLWPICFTWKLTSWREAVADAPLTPAPPSSRLSTDIYSLGEEAHNGLCAAPSLTPNENFSEEEEDIP
uniref:Uncharacterized protein n=1 Tax=Sphaerodactylus townsendi TaxID=933632 RepID=A0ACB8FRP4_9SAUR